MKKIIKYIQLIDLDEVIRKGDEYLNEEDIWIPIGDRFFGRFYRTSIASKTLGKDFFARRPITKLRVG